MNKVILIGRLCGDPELRTTQSGVSVTNYTLACDRATKREGQPSADFINIVAFAKDAEFAAKYLHKGMRIAVEGTIQTSNYTDKDGRQVYKTEVIVYRHEFCESKSSTAAPATTRTHPQPLHTAADTEEFTAVIDDNEDLPF